MKGGMKRRNEVGGVEVGKQKEERKEWSFVLSFLLLFNVF